MLQEAGNMVAVFVSLKGPLAKELEERGITICDHPGQVAFTPDIIHGQYNLETIGAMLEFRQTPAVFMSHGSHQWRERPPRFPRIFKYLAKCSATADWMAREADLKRESIQIIPGYQNLRALPEPRPLPETPKKALLHDPFPANPDHVRKIRNACYLAGIELETYSDLLGRSSAHLPTLLPEYDLVFATGNVAVQALAIGCGVVCFDSSKVGELVTDANFDTLFLEQFTARESSLELSAQLQAWSAPDITPLARKVRGELSVDSYLRRIDAVYREAIEASKTSLIAPQEELAATADWLIELAEDHHAVDRGFLDVRQQLREIERQRRQTQDEHDDLSRKLEIEKEKVRAVRRLMQEAGFISQGLQKRIDEAWREIENQPVTRDNVSASDDIELPT